MQRPALKWLLFAACLAIFLGAMGWVSTRTLEMERLRELAEKDAQVQERLRLALWRMDAIAGSLVMRENTRPPSHYQAFYAPEDVFTSANTPIQKGRALVPSPLLGVLPEFVLLHFEVAPGGPGIPGACMSPQVPTGKDLQLATAWYSASPQAASAAGRLQKLNTLLLAHPEVISRAPAREDRSAVRAAVSASGAAVGSSIAPGFDPVAPPALGVVEELTMKQEKLAPAQAPDAAQTLAAAANARQGALNTQELTQRNALVRSQSAAAESNRLLLKRKEPAPQELATAAPAKVAEDSSRAASSAAKPISPPQLADVAKRYRSPAAPPPAEPAARATPAPAAAPAAPAAGAESKTAAGGLRGLPATTPQPSAGLVISSGGSAAAPAPMAAQARAGESAQADKAAIAPGKQPATQAALAAALREAVSGDASSVPKADEGRAAGPAAASATVPPSVADAFSSEAENPLKPFDAQWIEGELFLLREATLDSRGRLQGVWLDWPRLEQRLLAAIEDLLPSARLLAAPPSARGLDAASLASLPARLVPGVLELPAATLWSPLRRALAIAWGCFLLASLAVALVLHRAVTLSERRGAFVSAVTHELRTPLTTFRLYSEMLADDMVPDAAARQKYLRTLCDESTRLTHLVENVLAYSRIERGRAAARVEEVTLSGLVARIEPRLRQRATEASLELEVALPRDAAEIAFKSDAMGVEQILFNLVDNACKYAGPAASPRTLHLAAEARGTRLVFRVRDHGPGFTRQQMKRLFQPFEKSATEAAHTAPGVGLGLALCRRLAREMGGDLCLESAGPGACFALTLPRA